ncbi:two-component sensor histidine kinase [Clostridium folliculivorans]|uniref:histidine kinase n=1 Tax=Clostridium folliculivorans TaxID=2886038 RepID=A0A9W5Y5A3_9CLOT|nr:HAMP domain-containing sensor histidine kinase [Clostridium folliculivorans]GKU26795.1 two-component sensor histidine kinase [Clostridium folliculivorans]GKU31389.1 two-component sensor histidine kinase [Clostridium folliculivorans]
MIIAVVVLSMVVLLLVLYIVFLQLQLKNINQQLIKRLKEDTHQSISLELINKELNTLVSNINRCLKEDETRRVDLIRKEKYFKDMIANISHDLRTPLTAIKGYQQLIGRGTLSKEQFQKLQIAQKHADELGRLIENFFEYSYLVNTEPIFKMEKINVTNLMSECLVESINLFEENKLEVQFEEKHPIFIFADKEMIVRIIRNLIKNCIQHSASNIQVKIVSEKTVSISFKNLVRNTEQIDVKKLFDRFYSVDEARGKSTGLGLAIVKLLAEQMDGSVEAFLQDKMLEICVNLPVLEELCP